MMAKHGNHLMQKGRAAKNQFDALDRPDARERVSRRRGAAGSGGIRAVHVVVLVVSVILATLLGGVVDRFVLGTAVGGSLGGRITVSEGELRETVATYSYAGRKTLLSAREALEEQGKLSSAANTDGTFDVPTADDVLAVVRNRILVQEAERRGISVSEQDVLAYAESTLGTRSLTDIAAGYGSTEEAIYAQVRQAALMQRLRAEVVSEARPEAPAMPPEPEPGEEVAALEKYGAYIVGVAGDAWDAAAGTWAQPEGDFATALAGYEVSPASATYDAALQAYWVAYQRFAEQDAAVSAIWTDYVNALLSQASIAISTLAI